MQNPFKKEDPQLQDAIAAVYKEMEPLNADAPEYEKCVQRLKDLNGLKSNRPAIDPNTVLTIAGNVFIAMTIITHEQTAVITTKLLPFLAKKVV